jgi:hypothetical protein
MAVITIGSTNKRSTLKWEWIRKLRGELERKCKRKYKEWCQGGISSEIEVNQWIMLRRKRMIHVLEIQIGELLMSTLSLLN